MEIKSEIFNKTYVKNTLSAAAIVFFGMVLINMTFIFYAAVINLILLIFPNNFSMTRGWLMPLLVSSVTLVILTGSFFILRSKISTIYKAIYSTVPLIITYVVLGISFYRWPVIAYSAGGFIFLAVIVYLYLTKKPWLYYFTVIFWSAALLIFNLLGGEI